MKVKSGDRVKINKKSYWYYENQNEDSNNPNCEGTVSGLLDCSKSLPIVVKWDNKTRNSYSEKDLDLVTVGDTTKTTNTIDMQTISQIQEQAVRDTVKNLLVPTNKVSTLEVKMALRKSHPQLRWEQQLIHDLMDTFYQNGELLFNDNGTFREYYDPKLVKVAKVKVVKTPTTKGKVKVTTPTNRISRSKALDIIDNLKGKRFTAIFTKKDGTERTINGSVMPTVDGSKLGYITVKEASILKRNKKLGTNDNAVKQINLQTLKSLKANGQTYKIR